MITNVFRPFLWFTVYNMVLFGSHHVITYRLTHSLTYEFCAIYWWPVHICQKLALFEIITL